MISLRIPILLMASGLIVTVPAIAWSAAKPVERKVDPEVAKKKQEEAKAAAEKAAAEKTSTLEGPSVETMDVSRADLGPWR